MQKIYWVVGILAAAAVSAVAGYEYAYSEMRSAVRTALGQPNNAAPANAVPATPNVGAPAGEPASPEPTAAPSEPPKPAWNVEESKNPLNDKLEVVLSMMNEGEIRNKFGSPAGAMLIVRCKDNSTDLFVATDEFFGTMDEVSVSYRIDETQAVSASWSASTNGKAVFAPSPIPLAKEMAKGKSVFVRISGNYGAKVEAKFPLIGLSEHLPKVATACGWKL